MLLTSVILWAILLLAAAFLYYVRYVEPNRLETEQVQVQISGLPAELAGLKIAHLSDLHVRNSRQALTIGRQAVADIMAHKPDVVFMTGDIGHRSWHAGLVSEVLEPLAAEYGVYAVLGNHDLDYSTEMSVFWDTCTRVALPEWVAAMNAIGVDLLFNEHRCVQVNDTLVVIGGVGDPSCGYDDLAKALADAPRGDLNILLSHSPDIFDEPGVEWADLILCGHTHGGQLQLPCIGTPWAPVWRRRDRASGLMRVGEDTVGYVSRGAGAGTGVRFNCPPEVAILTLSDGYAENLKVVK